MQPRATLFWLPLAALGLGLGCLFWPELSDTWSAALDGLQPEAPQWAQLPMAESAAIVGFRQGAGPAVPTGPRTRALQSRRQADGSVELRFALSGPLQEGGYPSLRIYLFDGSQRLLRTLVLSNHQYAHGNGLELAHGSEAIALRLPLRPGEAGYTVQAFFPAH